MTQERRNQIAAAFLVWQFVASGLLGLNAGAGLLNEPWTNWNFLFLGLEASLIRCAFRRIIGFQQVVATWLASIERRLGP